MDVEELVFFYHDRITTKQDNFVASLQTHAIFNFGLEDFFCLNRAFFNPGVDSILCCHISIFSMISYCSTSVALVRAFSIDIEEFIKGWQIVWDH